MQRRAAGDGSLYYGADKGLWVAQHAGVYRYSKYEDKAREKVNDLLGGAGVAKRERITVSALLYQWLEFAIPNLIWALGSASNPHRGKGYALRSHGSRSKHRNARRRDTIDAASRLRQAGWHTGCSVRIAGPPDPLNTRVDVPMRSGHREGASKRR
jgi:hypothetical protein